MSLENAYNRGVKIMFEEIVKEEQITLKAVVPDLADHTVYGYEIKIKTVGLWPILSTEEIQELIKLLTLFADLTGMDGCEVEVTKTDLNNS